MRGPYKGKSEYSIGFKLKKGLSVSDTERATYRDSRRKKKRAYHYLSDLERRTKRLLYNAQTRSKKLDLICDLSFDWLYPKIVAGTCEVTGIAFDLGPSLTTKNKYAPSLDRKDSSKGYTETTFRLLCGFTIPPKARIPTTNW